MPAAIGLRARWVEGVDRGLKMKRRLLATVDRRLLRISVPVILLAPWIAVERAEATCTPPSPVNGTVVTCSGATDNANGTIGYGSTTDTGNTINVVSGGRVSGTNSGITLQQGTVNIAGNIIGGNVTTNGATGIAASGDLTLKLDGNIITTGILAAGTNAIGVSSGGTINLENAGSITAVSTNGVAVSGGTVNLTNTGAITGSSAGVSATSTTISNRDGATISAGQISGAAINVTNALVNNAGSIIATGGSSNAISAVTVTIASNTGAITGVATAISFQDAAKINNGSGGLIQSTNGEAILGQGTATVANAGQIVGIRGIVADTVIVTSNSSLISVDLPPSVETRQ